MNTNYRLRSPSEDTDSNYHSGTFPRLGSSPERPGLLAPVSATKYTDSSLPPKSANSHTRNKSSKDLSYVPELTLDDLREKIRVDGTHNLKKVIWIDHDVKKNIDFDKQERVMKNY
jgi:hypothetical protein